MLTLISATAVLCKHSRHQSLAALALRGRRRRSGRHTVTRAVCRALVRVLHEY